MLLERNEVPTDDFTFEEALDWLKDKVGALVQVGLQSNFVLCSVNVNGVYELGAVLLNIREPSPRVARTILEARGWRKVEDGIRQYWYPPGTPLCSDFL